MALYESVETWNTGQQRKSGLKRSVSVSEEMECLIFSGYFASGNFGTIMNISPALHKRIWF